MPRTEKVLVSFNRGVVTPLLDGRSDLNQLASACRTLENMVVESQGSVVRRAGTRFIAAQRGFDPNDTGGGLVVYDSVESSGVRGSDVWSLFAEMTLSPFGVGDELTMPQLHIRGTFSGSTILMGIQILRPDGFVDWQNIYECHPGPEENKYISPAGETGAPFVGPLRYPPFDSPNYVFPGDYNFDDGVFYRFRVFGQIDPDSGYGNFVTSNYFTLSGGFEPDGFTPP